MTWHDLTIEQAQQVYNIIKDDNVTDFEKEIKVLCLLLNYDEGTVNSWPLSEYREKAAKIGFFHYPIPEQKPSREFKINGKRYFVNYDMQKVSFGQYNEVMAFSNGPDYLISNLHKIMATICNPVKGFWLFKKASKDKSHDEISEDMKKAPFLICYHAAVFFYQVYKECLKNIRPYLASELMEKGMTIEQATEATAALQTIMDGFGQQKKWQIS